MRTLIPMMLLVAAVLAFFSNVLFGDRVLLSTNPAAYEPWAHYAGEEARSDRSYRTDALLTYLPRQAELSRRIRSGDFPLWNASTYCGAPFLADPQSRVLYPLSVALAFAAPARAMGYDVVIHFLVAMLGMYLFLRAAGAGAAGRLLGALSYGFSSFMFTRTGHPTFVASAAYVPWFIFALETVRGGWRFGGPFLVLLLALGYLAGFPQVFLFGAATLVIYAVWTALDDAARGLGHRAFAALPVVAIAAVLSAMVVAVQLIPFREYMQNSVGLGLTFRAMAEHHIWHPAFLLRSVAPGLFGTTAEGTSWLPLMKQGVHHQDTGLFIYVGVAGLLLALGSLAFARRSRHIRALLFILLLSVGIGTSSVLLRAAYFLLPFIKYSQVDRISVISCFALSALAGLSFSMAADVKYGASRKAFRIIIVTAALAIAVAAVFSLAAGDSIIAGLAERAAGTSPNAWRRPSTELAGKWLAGDFAGWLAHERREVARALFLSLASVALLLGVTRTSGRRFFVQHIATAALLLLMTLDTGGAARAYYVTQASDTLFETRGIAFLKQALGDRGMWRVINLPSGNEALPPNTNQIFGIHSIRGRSTLFPEAYLSLLMYTRSVGEELRATGSEAEAPAGAAEVATAARVACGRYLFAPASGAGEALPEGCSLVHESDIRVYENRNALEKGIVIPKTSPGGAPGRIRTADLLFSPDLDTCGTCALESYEDEKVVMRVKSSADCFVVFQDLFYPGWVARVDGSRVPVLGTDLGFRAIPVLKGEHLVEMEYRPRSVTIGMLITFLGIALSIVYVAKTSRTQKPRG